jgi:hypothetical protein
MTRWIGRDLNLEVQTMDIKVRRYPEGTGTAQADGSLKRYWDGIIEPSDKSWILFLPVDGALHDDGTLRKPSFYAERDSNGDVKGYPAGSPAVGIPENAASAPAVIAAPASTYIEYPHDAVDVTM